MREIRLSDGSSWRLETAVDSPPSNESSQDRRRREATVARRSYVWVRCVGSDVEFRLMFAAAWELWSETALAGLIAAERDRLAEGSRAV